MGLRFLLIFPPLVLLLASIFLQTGLLTAGGQSINYCNANNVDQSGCLLSTVTNGNVTFIVIQCPITNVGNCNITDYFVAGQFCGTILGFIPNPFSAQPPSPAFCSNGQIYLAPGNNISVKAPNPTNTPTSNNGLAFVFAKVDLTTFGYVALLVVAIGVVAIAGITVFGSGFNMESIHILFILGILTSIWIILSLADGFVTGNPNSLFSSLNTVNINCTQVGNLPSGGTSCASVTSAAFGTGIYILSSLVFMIGCTGAISRGN